MATTKRPPLSPAAPPASLLQEFSDLVDGGEGEALRKPLVHGRDCRVMAQLLGAFLLRGRGIELPPQEMAALRRRIVRMLDEETFARIEQHARSLG